MHAQPPPNRSSHPGAALPASALAEAAPHHAPLATPMSPGSVQILEPTVWVEAENEHHAAVDALTADHRARSGLNRTHPVEDFLFTYYTLRPAQLRRWYPGAGIALVDAGNRADWRFHHTIHAPASAEGTWTAVAVDAESFWNRRATAVHFIHRLLTATASSPPKFGCFGLHEWAMVYRAQDRRHVDFSLRLGQSGTDDVVESQSIRCSHFDAFRFFTPEARPLNLLDPSRDTREKMEQPGCLHASMDLYKWAYRLVPVVSSKTMLDCFRLARDVREVDMRASPYDFTDLGYAPIPIETAAGRSEYVIHQRRLSERGQLLRRRLCRELEAVFADRLAAWAADSHPSGGSAGLTPDGP